MESTPKTRTQRRMEKRQAVILLVLILVVSLASFTLGVIVGRRGAERDLAQKLLQTEKVLVAQAPVTGVLPTSVPIGEKVVDVAPVEPAGAETKLSFYDDLAKETVPLGSGINLAPVKENIAVTKEQPPIELPDQPIVKKKSMVVASAETAVQAESAKVVAEKSGTAMPKIVPSGSHAVQIGSFGSAADAIALKQKLLNKNYSAFVVEADLGKKGLWYRVRIGPYADSVAAKLAQKLLEEKEQIKGFVSHQ
ncbi:MAG: SPOR domain-containing protein [Thermodesulfobacteriota bacterium]|nr:SPOR domain-containing protein [Thermodesulfobacteriota bacterium]